MRSWYALLAVMLYARPAAGCGIRECPDAPAVLERYAAARRSVGAALANMSDAAVLELPCRAAGAHGRLSRASSSLLPGCRPTDLFCDAETRSRTRFARFPLFAPCQLYVSHKYRAVFVRQPKSASTAILQAAKAAFCDTRSCHRDEFAEVKALRPHVFADYAVFTFVRNPWTRAVSAYRMMHKWILRERRADGTAGRKCGVPFKAYARDADVMLSACSVRACCPYVPGSGALAGGDWAPWFIEQHVNDQSGCTSVLDFVGRAEHAQDDWDALVELLNERLDVPAVPRGVVVRNPNSQAPGGRVPETQCRAFRDAGVVRDVALQYAADVLRFGYLYDPLLKASPPPKDPLSNSAQK